MSGRRNGIGRSKGPQEIRTIGIGPKNDRNTTGITGISDKNQEEELDYERLYDGAVIPRRQYHDNYRHPNHFRIWKQRYAPYIKQLYETFANAIVTPDNVEKLSKVSIFQFIEFVYAHSSGYISEFA
jgi:hypothetical protein